MNTNSIKNEEKFIFMLRDLYEKFGYTRYKMSKFEEYELYARNKDFLVSDSVITFTDTNGKLMALKPDVTLSIVKNTRDLPGQIQKLYYNENVYRVSKGTHSFREIMQVGLECIGDIDNYCILEVLMLAAKSLRSISPDCVLNISHLGLLAEVINGVPEEMVADIYACISGKKLHEVERICVSAGIDESKIQLILKLITCYGSPKDVLPDIKKIFPQSNALDQFIQILEAFSGTEYEDMIRIDFSVMSDMNYYNGFVFKGFINGIPSGVLSGGQYDRLMCKMNRKACAIGFAVYLDLLERLQESEAYDADIVLLYDAGCDMKALIAAVNLLNSAGRRVLVQKNVPENMRWRTLARFANGEVKVLEEYA